MHVVDYIALGLICWFLSLFLFGFLSIFIKIKLPFLKNKYKDKVDPIYKLEKEEYGSKYTIRKYKLGWKSKEDFTKLECIFPPLLLFRHYDYIENNASFGLFSKNDILEEKINFNLKDYYEKCWEETYWEQFQEKNRDKQFQENLDGINHEFLENYE